MDIRLAVPDELDDYERREALNAALESCTVSAAGQVRRGIVPPAAGMIKARKVRWEPEPPGAEHFDLPGTVIRRGHGDCDDLGPWHAGSLRAAGIDPGARAIVKKSGPKRWHCVVQRSDGSIEDPSAHAGMYSVSGVEGAVAGAGAPIHAPMSAEGRLCIAICPSRDRRHPLIWFARCDVPDRLDPWEWSSAAAHPSPKDALLRAIKTVRHVAGEAVDPEDDARLACLVDLVCGADPHDVADELSELVSGADDGFDDDEPREQMDVDQVVDDAVQSVGFLDALTKPFQAVARAVAPVARRIAPFAAATPFAPMANALASGDPMQIMAAAQQQQGMRGGPGMMPGAGQPPPFMQAREFFSKNPLGPAALPIAQQVLPTMFPGMGSLFMQLATPPGMQAMPGGFDPMSLLSMFGGGGGAGFNPMSLLSSFGGGMMPPQVPQQPGWAPPNFAMDRGAVLQQPGGGPAFMRF